MAGSTASQTAHAGTTLADWLLTALLFFARSRLIIRLTVHRLTAPAEAKDSIENGPSKGLQRPRE